MKTITLADETARIIYKTADSSLKQLLEENFGKEFFNIKLTDTIKCLSDIYRVLNRRQPILSDYVFLLLDDREQALYLQYQLDIIKCFNSGWKSDFTNTNEYKYYLWWERTSSGWVLGAVYGYGSFSRLCSGFYFKRREDAEFCAKLFKDIFTKTL